jgi:hypothetical protein
MTVQEVIAAVACPVCGSPVGKPCRRTNGVHPKRRGLAERAASWFDTSLTPGSSASRLKWLRRWRMPTRRR